MRIDPGSLVCRNCIGFGSGVLTESFVFYFWFLILAGLGLGLAGLAGWRRVGTCFKKNLISIGSGVLTEAGGGLVLVSSKI